jgi:hypothetical protein
MFFYISENIPQGGKLFPVFQVNEIRFIPVCFPLKGNITVSAFQFHFIFPSYQ